MIRANFGPHFKGDKFIICSRYMTLVDKSGDFLMQLSCAHAQRRSKIGYQTNIFIEKHDKIGL